MVNTSVGYYYQISDMKEGSGLLRRLAYEISGELTAGVNIYFDEEVEKEFQQILKFGLVDQRQHQNARKINNNA